MDKNIFRPLPFGHWLRQRRTAFDYTQEELAERAGCSVWTIQKIETGTRRPSRQIAELLAACLGVPDQDRDSFIRFARTGSAATPDSPATTRFPHTDQHAQERGGGSEPEQAPPTNLPTPLTAIIGREEIVTAIISFFLTEDRRLVTLTGPPGIGKTRLAIEVGARLLNHYPDGVFFVPVASIHDPALVPRAIAQAVDLVVAGPASPLDSLKSALKSKRAMLVLDNCEQVVSAATHIAELLQACPLLCALTTSREALRVRGERQLPVPALNLPDIAHVHSAEQAMDYSSVALFVERAQEMSPHFRLDGNTSAVTALCTRLDGLPLAIELAAARIETLSPQEIEARLDRSLQLLDEGQRDLPPRQQTLRAAISWSYDLLTREEQTLFARMGVFVGGCTQAAVEAVCNAQSDLGVPAGVSSLVSKNLVRQELRGDHETRYTMLETIHEYALERLEASSEAGSLHRLHAEYYLALARAADPELTGPQMALWRQRLETEHDNLRAALRWSLDSDGGQTALALSGVLWGFWEVQGHLSEGRRWMEEALAAGDPDTVPASLREKAFYGVSWLAWLQGDGEQARAFAEESARLCRESGDKRAIARSTHSLAIIVGDQGDAVCAWAYYKESLALWREIGDKAGIARVLNSMGVVAQVQGNLAEAAHAYSQSMELQRELGHKRSIALQLANLAYVAQLQGDYERARGRFMESLMIREELGIKVDIIVCLAGLAGLAAKQQPTRAARLFGATDALAKTMDYTLEPAEHDIYERSLALARSQLDSVEFAAAWTEGAAMSLEEAVAYALAGDV